MIYKERMAKPILYWDRKARKEATEVIYGESFMRWFYEKPSGRLVTNAVLSRKPFSVAYGALQSSRWSARKIKPFIRDFNIRMEEYVDDGFRSFNDFFIRKFKPGARPFAQGPGEMPAFAEARYLAFESIRPDQVFPVKGQGLAADALLGDPEKARPFMGGPLLLARLCPVDYHRYHYPDAGRTLESFPVHGLYHSVSPLALAARENIFITNERRVSILETKSFGKLAYIEVGAICVGRIVQSHDESKPFARGDEKGYFLFGGSTVIVLGEPGRWKPDADLLAQTAEQRETFVQLGDRLAVATRTS